MKYFNATKNYEKIIFHYNSSYSEDFVTSTIEYLNEAIKIFKKNKMTVNIEEMRKGEDLNVYVYPTVQLFNKVFYSEIDRRYHRGKKDIGDIYMVQTSASDIHVVIPQGRSSEAVNMLKAALLTKILAEYTNKDELTIKQFVVSTIKMVEKKKQDEKDKEEQEEKDRLEEEKEQEEREKEEKERLEEEEKLKEEEEAFLLEEYEIVDKKDNDEEITEQEMENIYISEIYFANEEKKQKEQEEKLKSDEEKEKKRKKDIKNKEPKSWLKCGYDIYRKRKLSNIRDLERFQKYISSKGITKFTKLRKTRLFESSRYEQEQAAAFVDYLITTYGAKSFMKIYEDPSLLKEQKIFGKTKFVFESEAKSYIKDNYIVRAKKEIDKEDNNMISKIITLKENDDGSIETNTIAIDDEVKTRN